MLKFRNGILLPLAMSAEGTAAADAGGGSAVAAGGANTPAAAGAADQAWAFPTEKAFAEYLPEKYRNDPSLRDIKSFDGLVGSYINAAKMTGLDKGKILQLPNGDDDAEGFDRVASALGRPEKFEDYKLPPRADGKAYSEQDAALQSQLLPVLHKAGLSQRQINAIVPEWNKIADAAMAANDTSAQQRRTDAEAKLKTDFGAAYDEKVGLAQAALAHYGNDDLVKELDATGLGDHPEIVRMFAKLGAQLKEDGLIGKDGGGGGGSGALSPAEAQQQIAAKQADKEFAKAYFDAKHPEHAKAVEEMKRLYEFAHPEPQKG